MIQWFLVAGTLLCELERGGGGRLSRGWSPFTKIHMVVFYFIKGDSEDAVGIKNVIQVYHKQKNLFPKMCVRISPFSHVWRAGPIPLFPLCYCTADIGTTSACLTDNNALWDTSYLNLTPTTLKFVVRTNKCFALWKQKKGLILHFYRGHWIMWIINIVRPIKN